MTPMVRIAKSPLVGCVLLIGACGPFSGAGQVVLDGTLGRAGALSGPNFQITPDLGRQVGANLFHSFSQFNLVQGESATFSGPNTVQNILARVTGGNASSIDGTIASAIAGANFYFLNPAGVLFGPHAQINVSGSFTVSTASYLKLADGGRFDAANPANDVLTAAPVAAFGFLDSNPGSITVNGSQLTAGTGQKLALVGGDVQIQNGARLYAPDGTVNIASMKAAGEISDAPDLADIPQGGTINMSGGATIDVSGDQGGRVVIRGGQLVMDGAAIEANTAGAGNGSGVDVAVGGDFTVENTATVTAGTSATGQGGPIFLQAKGEVQILNGGSIYSFTSGPGQAGAVTLQTGSLLIDDEAGSQAFTGLASETLGSGNAGDVNVQAQGKAQVQFGGQIGNYSFASGNAGALKVVAGDLEILEAGELITSAQSTGAGGKIEISADTVGIDGFGLSRLFGVDLVTGILAETVGAANGGPGGNVSVQANNMSLRSEGQISTRTAGSGPAGQIEIKAQNLTIDDPVSLDLGQPSYTIYTGIGSRAESPSNAGRSGDVAVDTASLEISGEGTIFTTTLGPADSGNVQVKADTMHISGNQFNSRGIETLTQALDGSGRGGDITITANRLEIQDGGRIATSAEFSGGAGQITISGGTVQIGGEGFNSFISSQGPLVGPSTGSGGNVSLDVEQLDLLAGGYITTSVLAAPVAGRIDIKANDVRLDGQGAQAGIVAEVYLFSSPGVKGGEVSINANTVELLAGGSISTSTAGTGDAGSISITTRGLRVDGNGQGADAVTAIASVSGSFEGTPSGGNGGDITLKTGSLEVLNGGMVTASSLSTGAGGHLTITSDTILLSGEGSALSAEAKDFGPGGGLDVSANQLQVLSGARISSSTSGLGDAGKVKIACGSLVVDGGGAGANTGLFSASNYQGAGGKGGDIEVQAGSISMNGGSISAKSSSTGNGGIVQIVADNLSLAGGASIDSASQNAGNAGSISMDVTGPITLTQGSQISTKANQSNAEGITITSRSSLTLDQSQVTSQAALDGGEIRLTAPSLIQLTQSSITSQAGRDGGNIFIDPQFLVLNQSQIIANAIQQNAGNITINAGYLIASPDSVISASSEFGLNGQISILGPVVDFVGSLVPLPSGFGGAESQLPERCAVRLPGNLSSFISIGRGGLPPDPTGALPSFVPLESDREPRAHH